VPENLHRLIELLNLPWLLQNRDRTNLKNPIEDLAIRVTCDHDNVDCPDQSAWLFYTPDHPERQAIFSEAMNGLFSRPTTTRLKPICFKNVRKRSCRPRSQCLLPMEKRTGEPASQRTKRNSAKDYKGLNFISPNDGHARRIRLH
jgi:hypothetical protein